MNVNDLIDNIDDVYFISDKMKKEYPILKDCSIIYRPMSKAKNKYVSRATALDMVKKCNMLGFKDWRLPNVFENPEKYLPHKCVSAMKVGFEMNDYFQSRSEFFAIIDWFIKHKEEEFLCLNECWFYHTANKVDNNNYWCMAGDCMPCYAYNDDIYSEPIFIR